MKLRAAMFTLAMALAPSAAAAQVAMPCGTCDECTRMLAQPDAEAQLSGDISEAADRCITIRGAGARFHGGGHEVRVAAGGAGTVGVSVEADDVMVHNVRVTHAATGVSVRGRGATLFRVDVREGRTGVALEGARDAHIVRSAVHGAAVGIRSGALTGDACAAGAMTDPGLVVARSTIEDCEVGVAACGAAPVLASNVLARNGVGVLLGSPTAAAGPGGDGPFDACVQAPTLDHVRAGTLLLFSSGCGGCQVHEGWVPSLRRRGADLRVRETGPDHEAAQRRFDHHMRHCAPEVIDALGVPGCVPNYACPVRYEVGKVRSGERQVAIERAVDSEDTALSFAQDCAATATTRLARGRLAALVDNYVCQSRRDDIRGGAGVRGTGNHCDRATGWRDEGATAGCASPCGGEAPAADHAAPPAQAHDAPPTPTLPMPAPPVPPPTNVVTNAPASPYATPSRALAPSTEAEGGGRATKVIAAAMVLLGAAVWWALSRMTRRP